MQTLEDAISRLEQMGDDQGDTWDLSPNDQDAIRQVLANHAMLITMGCGEISETLRAIRADIHGLHRRECRKCKRTSWYAYTIDNCPNCGSGVTHKVEK
jgi:hypothetical protein